MDSGGGSKMECKRLGVGGLSNVSSVGSVSLGVRMKATGFLARSKVARSEAVGITASTSWGLMVRREGAGAGLTTRKGMRTCAAELGGRDGTGSGSVNKGRVMLATYSDYASIESGHDNGESEGHHGADNGN